MEVELGAVLTPMVTPFDARGRVDEEAAVRLMHHLLEHGSDGLVLCGTTGEASTLTDEEQLELIGLAVREVKPEHPGCTIVAGAGSNDTRHAVHLTERASELGVDAVLSVTPYYNRPNRRGIIRHYEEIDRATDRPIVLYNIPQRTAVDMPNDLLAELAQLEHVVAVKQSNDDNLAKVDGLQIYAGNDDAFADVLDLGEPGGILVAAHLFGEELRRMVDEPERRREIDAGLARRVPRPGGRAAGVLDEGGAEHDRPAGGRPQAALRGAGRARDRGDSRDARTARTAASRPGVSGTLRVLPLGGLGEIGKNMMVVEYDGRIVVVDTGLRFPTTDMLGIDLVLPDFSYLRERVDDIEAFVITHGHEDHLGALPWVLRQLGAEAPVYGGPADDRDGALEARRAPAARRPARGSRSRRAADARAVRARARAHDPFDSRLVRRGPRHRARSRGADRGLQVRPDPGRRAAGGRLAAGGAGPRRGAAALR